MRSVNQRFRAEIPEAAVFGFLPPSIPGLGSAGGFSFWLQDRSGGTVEFLNENLQKFLDAAKKRPELQNVTSTFRAAVPQVYVDVDRDKALKQGVPIADVYASLQTFLGGSFVNQFNRFGRQWRVFMQADAADRMTPDDIGRFYVRNNDGNMVPLSALTTVRHTSGPEYTQRFNLFRAAQITGSAAPGLQLRPGHGCARGGRRADAAARNGLRLVRPVVPGEESGRDDIARVRAVDRLRLPDPGGALRELVASVERSALGSGGGLRSVHRDCCCASSISTCTDRSGWSC